METPPFPIRYLHQIKLYGADVIKPNHHYAMHTPENVRDYGPLQEFWTFLFERMNKVLKSYNSSNHSGGELETSFFREFHRTVQTSRIVRAIHCRLTHSHHVYSWRKRAASPSNPRCISQQKRCTRPPLMIGEQYKLWLDSSTRLKRMVCLPCLRRSSHP